MRTSPASVSASRPTSLFAAKPPDSLRSSVRLSTQSQPSQVWYAPADLSAGSPLIRCPYPVRRCPPGVLLAQERVCRTGRYRRCDQGAKVFDAQAEVGASGAQAKRGLGYAGGEPVLLARKESRVRRKLRKGDARVLSAARSTRPESMRATAQAKPRPRCAGPKTQTPRKSGTPQGLKRGSPEKPFARTPY